MGITKKISVKELRTKDTYSRVLEQLKSDPENAYTISGLMIDVFGIKEKDINNKSFSNWPKGVPSLYTRIRICLEKLQKNGYVKSVKHSRAWVYYWIRRDEKPIITSANAE